MYVCTHNNGARFHARLTFSTLFLIFLFIILCTKLGEIFGKVARYLHGAVLWSPLSLFRVFQKGNPHWFLVRRRRRTETNVYKNTFTVFFRVFNFESTQNTFWVNAVPCIYFSYAVEIYKTRENNSFLMSTLKSNRIDFILRIVILYNLHITLRNYFLNVNL